jgi:hypothetical protein
MTSGADGGKETAGRYIKNVIEIRGYSILF